MCFILIKAILDMVLEKHLFLIPNPPQYSLISHKEHLVWLPLDPNMTQISSVPCMLYSPPQDTKFFIIWCHGTAEDIGNLDRRLGMLSRQLQAHILVFEYPGFGLLNVGKQSPSDKSINNHAQRAYLFVRDILKWPTDRIIVYGHSLGSGPACHLASSQHVGALILQSPYTSISNLIREKVGMLPTIFTKSYWENYKAMKRITCSVLFIHGERDNLIPSGHSRTLFNSLNHNNRKQLVLLPNDDHSSISDATIVKNAQLFLNEHLQPITESIPQVKIDPVWQQPPYKSIKK
jgi:pimeloyl-ACP methyl ester carboxylesterase